MLQPYLVINVTGLVQFRKKLSSYLHLSLRITSREQTISIKLIYQFFILLMVISSLYASKKSSKKKETKIKKEIVEVLQQPIYRKKSAGIKRSE